jgi:hypothetical protein
MKYLLFIALVTFLSTPAAVVAQKMDADQVVAKHLLSIGTPQKLSEIKNSVATADVSFNAKGTTITVNGKAVMAASGDMNLWGMVLNSNDYPQDKFGYNGKEVRAAHSRPGTYSTLGGFIRSYGEIVREGVLGGTLFSSWALLNSDARKPKLSFDGTKKIDGNETYVLNYGIRRGSDLSIKMFFDAKTFRHVRTEYNHTIAARQGTSIDNSAGQSPDRYKVIEDFSDFQNIGGLTLPKKYKLHYSYSGSASGRLIQSQYRELDWVFDVTNFVVNQDLDPASFDITGN